MCHLLGRYEDGMLAVVVRILQRLSSSSSRPSWRGNASQGALQKALLVRSLTTAVCRSEVRTLFILRWFTFATIQTCGPIRSNRETACDRYIRHLHFRMSTKCSIQLWTLLNTCPLTPGQNARHRYGRCSSRWESALNPRFLLWLAATSRLPHHDALNTTAIIDAYNL